MKIPYIKLRDDFSLLTMLRAMRARFPVPSFYDCYCAIHLCLNQIPLPTIINTYYRCCVEIDMQLTYRHFIQFAFYGTRAYFSLPHNYSNVNGNY